MYVLAYYGLFLRKEMTKNHVKSFDSGYSLFYKNNSKFIYKNGEIKLKRLLQVNGN